MWRIGLLRGRGLCLRHGGRRARRVVIGLALYWSSLSFAFTFTFMPLSSSPWRWRLRLVVGRGLEVRAVQRPVQTVPACRAALIALDEKVNQQESRQALIAAGGIAYLDAALLALLTASARFGVRATRGH